MKVYKSPEKVPMDGTYKIFLAGSIEMGKAIDWQTDITRSLNDIPDLTILNPRRDDWDDSWVQSIKNKQFREQVEWELDCLDRADMILLYFDPKTKSPISLLELGLHAREGRVVVCCPEGFWRKGNVEIVCKKYNLKLFESKDEFISYCKEELRRLKISR